MFKIYFGSPLFSDMEREYNKKVVERIRNHEKLWNKVEIYLPQENEAINDKGNFANSVMIAEADVDELNKSDLLIAVLDGQVVDVGLASEIGVAYALDIPTLGLYTDSRQGTYGNQEKINALDEIAESQFSYVNLFTVGLVKSKGIIVTNVDDLIQEIINRVESK